MFICMTKIFSRIYPIANNLFQFLNFLKTSMQLTIKNNVIVY